MLFKKKNKINEENENQNYIFIIVLFAVIVLAVLGMNIYKWTQNKTPDLLLAKADGMVQTKSIEDTKKLTALPFAVPQKLFNGELYQIGVYNYDSKDFPSGSVAMVYSRNNYRFFEIDTLSKGSLDEQKDLYKSFPGESVILNKDSSGIIVRLRSGFDCKPQKNKTSPSVCNFTKVLFFEHENKLIKIFADGNHVTDGELIEIARSI